MASEAGDRVEQIGGARVSLAPFGNHVLLKVNDGLGSETAVLLDERSWARILLEGQVLLWQQRGFPVDRTLAGS